MLPHSVSRDRVGFHAGSLLGLWGSFGHFAEAVQALLRPRFQRVANLLEFIGRHKAHLGHHLLSGRDCQNSQTPTSQVIHLRQNRRFHVDL